MATRFSATAAIGLVGGVLAALPAGAATAAAPQAHAVPSARPAARSPALPAASADKADCPAAHGVKPAMFGGVLDGIMGVGSEAISGLVNPRWGLRDAAGNHIGRQFAVRYDPPEVSGEILLNVPAAAGQPATSQHAATARHPATYHATIKKPANQQRSTQPFHKTGRKARSLPDTGVPMSAALGAVTALTALLAGIGTVLAARRRGDHEA